MEKKVAVLLSTYNGEKYLEEQLNSLCNQTYSNLEIVIRDDGSSDGTCDLIKKYQQKHNNIKFEEGTNLGFIKSFFCLLELADADYYAYCDQDDIWLENKVELAVQALNKADGTKPNLAFGNSDYYDENMKLLRRRRKTQNIFIFQFSLRMCRTRNDNDG